jgi:two-component system chemotaxis response regulator CheB
MLVEGLQRTTELSVTVAEHGMQVASGGVYIAPPENHMEMESDGRIKLLSTVPADKFAPSINILFNSLARSSRTKVVAALLTGMGNDGADGLLRLRQSRALTIAEHSSTSVVYGMPARAAEIGAAAEVLKLPDIGPRILEHIKQLGEVKRLRKSMISNVICDRNFERI